MTRKKENHDGFIRNNHRNWCCHVDKKISRKIVRHIHLINKVKILFSMVSQKKAIEAFEKIS